MGIFSKGNPAGGAAIQGASSLLGSLVSNAFAVRNARKTADINLQTNKELADYQWNKDLEMWNIQNEYNSPQEQMKRLKAAGLNPNMIYGSGSVVGNTSGPMPKYQAPERDQKTVIPNLDVPNILAMYQNYAQSKAQIDVLKENKEYTAQRKINEAVRNTILATEAEKKAFDLGRLKNLDPYYNIGYKAAQYAKIQSLKVLNQQLKNLGKDYEIKGQVFRSKKAVADFDEWKIHFINEYQLDPDSEGAQIIKALEFLFQGMPKLMNEYEPKNLPKKLPRRD